MFFRMCIEYLHRAQHSTTSWQISGRTLQAHGRAVLQTQDLEGKPVTALLSACVQCGVFDSCSALNCNGGGSFFVYEYT